MIVDAIAMLVLLFFALAGFRWGGLSQLMLAAITVTAVLSAPVFAPLVEPVVHAFLPEEDPLREQFWSTLLAGLIFFTLLCWATGRGIALIREGSFILRSLDGVLGLTIGAAIGASFSLLLAWGLWSGRVADTLPASWHQAVDSSLTIRFLSWLHRAPMHEEFAPDILSMLVS